jgi:hypothetical protein
MKKASIIFILFLFFVACNDNSSDNTDKFYLDEVYELACDDAAFAEQIEIWDSLTIIRADNNQLIRNGEYILVTTLTKYPESYIGKDTIMNDWGVVWVSVVPEMQREFSTMEFVSDSALKLRANQMLGLPHNVDYTHFAEIWVKPDDLFRPAPDNEITDSTVFLKFPPGTDMEYKYWFNETFKASFYPKEGPRYPWTRLGYTYDWNPESDEIGISEFVIRENSQIIVRGVKTVVEYLQN